MPDMVGSVGVALDPWGGAHMVIAQPTAPPIAAAEAAAVARELAWQTTVGQIAFLQSVVHGPT